MSDDKLQPTNKDKLAQSHKITIKKPLWQRTKEAEGKAVERRERETLLGSQMENRLVLMLDNSGSMASYPGEWGQGKTKIDYLRDAYDSFVNQVDFSNSSIGVETFPSTEYGDEEARSGSGYLRLPLTTDQNMLRYSSTRLIAGGGTPMADAMHYVINNYPVTRGILISDGEADSPAAATREAHNFKEAGVPIDCIHIGSATGGEALLKEIAAITGGIYIKFVDVAAFSKALSYLTPRYRAMLASGQVGAAEIGATEIKRLGGGRD